jgi:hypothetical protein
VPSLQCRREFFGQPVLSFVKFDIFGSFLRFAFSGGA